MRHIKLNSEEKKNIKNKFYSVQNEFLVQFAGAEGNKDIDLDKHIDQIDQNQISRPKKFNDNKSDEPRQKCYKGNNQTNNNSHSINNMMNEVNENKMTEDENEMNDIDPIDVANNIDFSRINLSNNIQRQNSFFSDDNYNILNKSNKDQTNISKSFDRSQQWSNIMKKSTKPVISMQVDERVQSELQANFKKSDVIDASIKNQEEFKNFMNKEYKPNEIIQIYKNTSQIQLEETLNHSNNVSYVQNQSMQNDNNQEENTCTICQYGFVDENNTGYNIETQSMALSKCWHTFHILCLINLMKNTQECENIKCPICRDQLFAEDQKKIDEFLNENFKIDSIKDQVLNQQ